MQPQPDQQPISIVSLRNRQISPQTFAAFKTKLGSSISVVRADPPVATDVAPGGKSTGVVTVRVSQGSQPEPYQLHFGNSQTGAVTAEAVL